MLFNSLEFLMFFPVVVGLYFACPPRFRWILLLGASYYFYAAWRLEYLLLIIISTLVDYVVSLGMARTISDVERRILLGFSLLTNLGILFGFKYFNFFSDTTRQLLNQFNIFYDMPMFDVLLPVGISFYTFQTLSYTIDVYRGKIEPEKHLGIFALYVAFFPQLVAGPIERATNMLPQFWQQHEFDAERVVSGLRLMLWGMFKKVVIADRLGVYVDAVYNNPAEYSGEPLLLATLFFTFQIYCDFSGYSDLAIGAARIMGYDLMENFRQPYFAQSIREFWQRWHISLSTWFRDYVYIPLGGNRAGVNRWYLNLLVTFVISGLWHGANWTFIVWGALHGFYLLLQIWTYRPITMLFERLGLEPDSIARQLIQTVVTFVLAAFAWIFFRANSISDAGLIISKLFSFGMDVTAPIAEVVAEPGLELLFAVALLLILTCVDYLQTFQRWPQLFHLRPVRWAAYVLLTLAILNLGVTTEVPFIYFQF